MAEYTPAELVQKWEGFFDEYAYSGRIVSLADAYPEARSLEVPYAELNRFDTDFAIHLLRHPLASVPAAGEAVTRIAPPGDEPIKAHVRVRDLPADARVMAKDLRSEHLGTFLAVEGVIRKVTEVRPTIIDATFQCLRCQHVIKEPQEGAQFREPMECHNDQGGCSRSAASTKFKLLEEASSFLDTQKVEVQDPPERLRGGEEPRRLEVHLEDDVTGLLMPGERVVLNGVLRSAQRGRVGARSTAFDIFLDANSLERERKEFDEVEVTEADARAIQDEASRPNVLERIVQSVAPTIYGMDKEKEALALQLFGGVPKAMPDRTRIRGDLNILLIGDPGTAKSQLLAYMALIAPRGILVSGKGASAAGLTAAAVKDDFGEGRWTLEAGAMVLGDKGLVCIDELEKMNPNDRGSIHVAMEQQVVHISKAGITATLPARCSVLAAANPKFGRFVREKYVGEQFALEPALLSRFDAIFPVQDLPEPKRDSEMAKHILHAHRLGEIMKAQEEHTPVPGEAEPSYAFAPYFPAEFLRKYVAFAKRIFPVLTREAMDRLHDHYVEIRREAEGGTVPITPRQLEAAVRLAEAAARARLSHAVALVDADRAIGIVEYWLRQVASEPGMHGGPIDIDIIATGIPASQRQQIVLLRDIIGELGGTETGDGANRGDILELAERRGIPRDRAEAWLRKWQTEGDLYCPTTGVFKLVSKL